MKILILGGTQFVGKHLVSEFLQRGDHEITVFNRGVTNPYYHYNIETLTGDRYNNDYTTLSDRNWDAVIDVPSFKPSIVKEALDFLYNSVNLYVFISTISVYDINKNLDTAYIDYCNDKLEAEKLFHGKELKSLIFRPGILCGEGDITQRFDYTANGIYWKGTGNLVEDYTTVEDFVKFVVDLIEQNKRGTYEYVGKTNK